MTAPGRPNKRVRFNELEGLNDDELQLLADTDYNSPFEASRARVLSTLTDLVALRESQKKFALEAHFAFIKMRKELEQLKRRKEKVIVENYQVRSTKFKFKLTASDRLLEENEAQVAALNEQAEISIKYMQEKLRENVASLLTLEIAALTKALRLHFAKTVIAIAASLAIIDPDIDEEDFADIYQIVFDRDRGILLGSSSMFKGDETNALYAMLHELRQTQNPAEFPGEPYVQPDTPRQYKVTTTSEVVLTFVSVLKTVFIEGWKTFELQQQLTDNSKRVREFFESAKATQSTAETAMDVDQLNLS